MITTQSQETIVAEIYAVKQETLPELNAWLPKIDSEDSQSVGWKMAYRLRNRMGGTWIWGEGRLVTDQSVTDDDMQDALKAFWNGSGGDFGNVISIVVDPDWKPNTLTIADFVASGLASLRHWDIKNLLQKYNRNISRARIEREHYVRGWDLNGVPVISISVSSTIASTVNFAKHARELSSDMHERVLGLFVRDKTSTMRGEIVRVIGKLRDHRARLLQLTKRKKMIEAINNASDEDLVVKIASGNNDYDYITSVLEIVVRTKDYKRLQIDGHQALRSLQIESDHRLAVVQEIGDVLANAGYIYPNPLSDMDMPDRFTSASDIGFQSTVKLGDGYSCQGDARTILRELKRHPVYRRSPNFEEDGAIKVGVLNFMGEDERVRDYLIAIRQEIRQIQFDIDFTTAERPDEGSQYEIEQAVDRLQQQTPHMIMVFVPGTPNEGDDEDGDFYHILKGYMVGNNIQSQFIYERTLDKQYALSNIILGIIAKTGNVPYVLENSLPYADIVAGIDVARLATQRRSGSMSLPAVTRIYTSDGDFIRYILSEGPIEGETLPRATLRKLFPSNLFAGKRVLVHRDGPFRGNEMKDLYDWGEEIGSEFILVEVIKSGVPRLYLDGATIQRPKKGDGVIINDREAFLVSSLPPHKKSTPRPLYVKTDGKIPIEQALHSVLALTLLHYGSVLQPRLPVTIHFSDRIGYLALQGVKPQNSEGDQPYWL